MNEYLSVFFEKLMSNGTIQELMYWHIYQTYFDFHLRIE